MATWDAVWLNDEIDLLEWRAQLLGGVVDHLLVVEGDRYFSGPPKDSCVLQNEARLAALPVRLHHVIVTLDADAGSAWDRENQQRRGMGEALDRLAAEGDLLIVGDVDEVPRPSVVRLLAQQLDRPVRLHMAHANYFANWVQANPWRNSAWAYRQGQAADHQMLRVHLGEPHREWDGYVEEFVPDAGWHLSFLGGEQAIRSKWAAYAHQEFNNSVDAQPRHLEQCFATGVHFQGRELLRKLPREEVSAELQSLDAVRADFFRYEQNAARWRAISYLNWTWMRRERRFPAFLRRPVDRSRVLLGCLTPLLLLVHAVRRVRRRSHEPRRWIVEREWAAPHPRQP
jgi:beta-1,4-mannosyl-glycoprotein beta-1,4-N-acetylglucosaminyltransferase